MAVQTLTKTKATSTRVARNGSATNGSGSSGAILPLHEMITPGLRWLIVITVMAATGMEFLDTTIVNVAIPSMMGNLGATLDDIGWVSTGYIITNVIVLPLTGWLSDYF